MKKTGKRRKGTGQFFPNSTLEISGISGLLNLWDASLQSGMAIIDNRLSTYDNVTDMVDGEESDKILDIRREMRGFHGEGLVSRTSGKSVP